MMCPQCGKPTQGKWGRTRHGNGKVTFWFTPSGKRRWVFSCSTCTVEFLTFFEGVKKTIPFRWFAVEKKT